MNAFDAVLFFILGGIALYMGFTNKKTTIWSSFLGRNQRERWSGGNYARLINIVTGLVCVIIGGLIIFRGK